MWPEGDGSRCPLLLERLLEETRAHCYCLHAVQRQQQLLQERCHCPHDGPAALSQKM